MISPIRRGSRAIRATKMKFTDGSSPARILTPGRKTGCIRADIGTVITATSRTSFNDDGAR